MSGLYERLMGLDSGELPFSYTSLDTMLYALSIGMGRDPTDPRELDYVFEQGATMRVLPTQACVVARSNLLHDCGLDRKKVLHGEQQLQLHRPLPAAGELMARSRVLEVQDKGVDKGLVIRYETRAREASTSEDLFSAVTTILARGNGGIGGPKVSERPPLATPPARAPDHCLTTATRPEQALLYRLTGDRNPLHADPQLAARLGYRVPILHGMCTYGIACRELLVHLCGHDPARLATLEARFTAPVFPGESITTDLWVERDTAFFRCRVAERHVTVLDYGRCVLRGTDH